MWLSDEGDFVDFNDYAAMLAEKDKEIERLKADCQRLINALSPFTCCDCNTPASVCEKKASIARQALAATAQDTTEQQIAFAAAAFSQELPEEMKPAQGDQEYTCPDCGCLLYCGICVCGYERPKPAQGGKEE